MSKSTSKFVCQQCGFESLRWLGKCPNCEAWNSLVETRIEVSKAGRVSKVSEGAKPIRLSEVKGSDFARTKTGIGEFDRVLGGGIVPGSVTLLAGEPGIGKSTLLLQVAASVGKVFYVSGEESPGQIKLRAERLGISAKSAENIIFLNETNVDGVLEILENVEKVGKVEEVEKKEKTRSGSTFTTSSTLSTSLVIIDSIQTMWTSDLSGTAGSVGQVRECAGRLLNFAKSQGIPMFLVGHVNKEGAIAGPMVLSHLVDTVLFFEGERYQTLRILRGIKNRFGPTDEVGVFSMEEKGLSEVDNPSKLFLSEGREKVPGSVVTSLMEGSRPILIEVQALVVQSQLAIPRRVGAGIDYNRLQLLVAVLSRRAGLPLGGFDIFVNIVGGLRVTEPAVDLAICLAIASAWSNKPVTSKTCVLGEVGLLGEIRSVGQVEKRLKEAKRLGFVHALTANEAKTLREAIGIAEK
ncbi:MAG: DNA repair protein RadA [bacterium]|nr:DNA repair protein RadA [bacterium]